MTLYRMIYVREGKPRGTKFAARDAEAATRLAERWATAINCPLLTVKAVRPLQLQLVLAA